MHNSMSNSDQDAIDDRRWRAVKERHQMRLCRIAVGGSSFSSKGAASVLDAWADLAISELESFDADKWLKVEAPARLAELSNEFCHE